VRLREASSEKAKGMPELLKGAESPLIKEMAEEWIRNHD